MVPSGAYIWCMRLFVFRPVLVHAFLVELCTLSHCSMFYFIVSVNGLFILTVLTVSGPLNSPSAPKERDDQPRGLFPQALRVNGLPRP